MGLYTSPHILTIRERFRLASPEKENEMISLERLDEIGNDALKILRQKNISNFSYFDVEMEIKGF